VKLSIDRRSVKRIIEQTAWDIKRAVAQEVVGTAVELVVAGEVIMRLS
jgi:hypothetical protein